MGVVKKGSVQAVALALTVSLGFSSGMTHFASAAMDGANPLFAEDFSDASAAAAAWTLTPKLAIAGGKLSGGDWSTTESAVYDGQSFGGSFSYSADVTASAASSNWNATRMLFDYADAGNYYELVIGNKNSADEANVDLFRVVNGSEGAPLVAGAKYALSKQTTTLQVVVDGGALSVYALQGSAVTTLIDHFGDAGLSSGSGKIGLGTRSSFADFDNVRVVEGVDVLTPPPAPEPVPLPKMADGNFQVSGSQILDPDGQPFVMKGVNVNGPRWPWSRDTVQDASLITDAWKFNAVRVNMYPRMEHWNIANNMDLDGIVSAFTSKHVVAMIEDHDFTGSYPEATAVTEADGSHSMSLDELKAYWVDLANRYKDNPYVWFNILNEPGPDGLSSAASIARWKEVYEAVIQAIRGTGAQNVIVLDGHNWGQEGGFKNGLADSAILTNGPDIAAHYDNIVFSLHMYDNWMDGQSRLESYLDTAAGENLAVIIGEYGADNNATTSATAAMYNAAVSRSVGRLVWDWASEDDFDLTKLDSTTAGGGWEIDKTDGTRPANLSWMGGLVWDDTHGALTLPVTTDIPLLVNGNFEAGLDDWMNWSNAAAGTDAHGGTQSFHVAAGVSGGGGQFIIMKPNTTYKLSAWGKVSGAPEDGNAAVGVQYRPAETSPDADQIKQMLEFTDTSWTQKEITFTTGDSVAAANVFIWKAAANVDLDVDDISLAEQPPIVSNGGFEGGLDGWMNWSNAAAVPGGHSGLQSFEVAAGVAGGGGQYVSVKPNTSYRLTIWGKLSGAPEGGTADAGFQYRPTEQSPDTDQVKTIMSFDSTSWTQKEATFTTGSSVAQANVFVWKSAANVELLIDDVQLVEIPADEVQPDPEPQPDGFVIDAVRFHDAAGQEISAIPAGGFMSADVSVTRHGAEQPVTAAVVLYDPSGKAAAMSYMTKTMKDGESDSFTGGFILPANTAGYTVKVMLWNNAQEQAPLADPVALQGQAVADTVPPGAPTGLAASNVASTSLTLTWNAAPQADGVAGYIVKQGDTVLADNVTATQLDVTGLAYNTAYTFTVTAKDAAGNVSQPGALTAKTTKGNGNTNGNGNGNGNGKNK